MSFPVMEEKARIKRQHAERAIALAMERRWEEAVAANRAILEIFPDDVDASNRLGKALMELGRYAEARRAYSIALAIDPNNSIAKRNLDRLAYVKAAEETSTGASPPVEPHLFIEETGKTGFAVLEDAVSQEILARMTPGDPVTLRIAGRSLVVENLRGEYLGRLEPKLALRLISLMDGGNQYAAAVASVSDNPLRIIIKETYQHPSQAGRYSFPPRGVEGFRPYTKESLLKYGLEEEEEWGEEGEEEATSDWTMAGRPLSERERDYEEEETGFEEKDEI